jgi:hypothetical protein
MLGRSRIQTMKKNAGSASAVALQLAQDRAFRKRLLSAIEHSAEAGRRARRGVGLVDALGRLATDQTLLRELREARDDLQQAYKRLETKRRRGHKLRNVLALTALASVAGAPQLRERLAAVIAKASKHRQQLAELGKSAAHSTASATAHPHRLEDLAKEELYARAQEADIPGRSEMSKEQLIEALGATS